MPRALVIADRRPSVPLQQLLERYRDQIDLLITLGDLDFYDLRAVENWPDLPRIGVYGNHCGTSYLSKLGFGNVHHAIADVCGLRFIGMEGCPRYRKGAHQFTQEEAEALISVWPQSGIDVVLSHTPPYGAGDHSADHHPDTLRPSHHGWRALREYVERTQPPLVLHGHTHPEQSGVHLGRTLVRHVFDYEFIDL